MAELQKDTQGSPVSETDLGDPQPPPPSETGPGSASHDSASPEPASTPTRPEELSVEATAEVFGPSQPAVEATPQMSGPSQPAATSSPLQPHPHTFHGPAGKGDNNSVQQASRNPPLMTLNQLAIVTASQNKLPASNIKSIVSRLARHTQSSASKRGCWYKGDNYVDASYYSWRNLELFTDYQKQIYTPVGSVKGTCRK